MITTLICSKLKDLLLHFATNYNENEVYRAKSATCYTAIWDFCSKLRSQVVEPRYLVVDPYYNKLQMATWLRAGLRHEAIVVTSPL